MYFEYTLPICRCVVNASPRQTRGGATLNWAFYQPSSSAGGSFSSTSACKESTSHFAALVGLLLKKNRVDQIFLYILWPCAARSFGLDSFSNIENKTHRTPDPPWFFWNTKKIIFARKPGPQDCECEALIFYENMNTLPKTWTQKSSKQLEQRKSHGCVRSLPAPLRKKSAG